MRKVITLFTLILAFFSLQLSAQDRTITGKITSTQDNLGIPGATVVVVGTTIGTTTDVDGNFKVTVPATAKSIRVTAIGMKPKQVDLGASNNIDFALDLDALQLNEAFVWPAFEIDSPETD